MAGATAVGPAIDYLLAATAALPACAAPVIVSDGYNPLFPDSTLVLIGATDESGEIACTLKFGAIGPKSSSEEFDIPCGIYAHTGAPDAGAQKTVRDQVNAIFNAIISFILEDPSLGLTLGPAGTGWVVDAPLVQTNKAQQAAGGRSAFRLFTVKCINYFPAEG